MDCTQPLPQPEKHLESTFNEFMQPVGLPVADWHGAKQPARVNLTGNYVRLEPVDANRHAEDLHAAYLDAKDASAWTYLSIERSDTFDAYRKHVETISTHDDPLHFAVIDLASGKAVGTLSLMRIDSRQGVIEVGHVAYSPRLQRTRLATEALYLLMHYVFDQLGYRRFEWKCDALNQPSRSAALRNGFRFEGVFRQAMVYKGRTRDTAWFSIIDSEWPALRDCYQRWLDPKNFSAEGIQIERLSQLIHTSREHPAATA